MKVYQWIECRFSGFLLWTWLSGVQVLVHNVKGLAFVWAIKLFHPMTFFDGKHHHYHYNLDDWMTMQFITFYKTIAEWLDRELPNLPIYSLWSPQQGKRLSWFMQHLSWDRYRLIYMGGVNVSIGMTQLRMANKPQHRS